ncbi:hypothetical protein [Saccharibacillus sacchari]|uniref:Uncharacterized protein n=1 Tax=Saccharibacillus sacchari TaxID=456493 RepID=A0ACC6P8I3_9BACL
MTDILGTYKKRIALFKKLYRYDNGTYDGQRGVTVYDDQILSADEYAFMNELKWKANDISELKHDELIPAIAGLMKNERITPDRLIGEFVAAASGRYRRGVNGLTSLRFADLAPEHGYRPARKLSSCGICGFSELDARTCSNLSDIRESLWIGHHWSSPLGIYADLSERMELPEIYPTQEDAAALKLLLEAVDRADAEETPGKLEKRLSAEKVVKGNSGTRRALLDALAQVGVLPNLALPIVTDRWIEHETMVEAGMNLDTTQGRSDLDMPYAGWRGHLGVDWDAAKKWFGSYL